MNSTDKKARFVELRAQGNSYAKISEALHISKSTCTAWEAELRKEVAERKQAHLADLYDLYEMHRDSRIKRIATTLQAIEAAIATKDLAELPADVLLKLKLQYERELKAEYAEPVEVDAQDVTPEGIIAALATLYGKQKAGTVTPAQAKAQLATLTSLATAGRAKDASDQLKKLGVS